MKKKSCLTALLISFLFLFSTAYATTWYVHPDSALNSIQAGLDSCSANDTVLVAASTYYENIFWPHTYGIVLISESGYSSTIIDGGSAGSVIEMDSVPGVDSTTIISGFTVCNGYSFIGAGGGIQLRRSSPTIANNLITDNGAFSGAGIMCSFSSAIIIDNTITGNIADQSGGGITCGGTTSPRIIGNLITDNTALSFGGGIYCRNDSAIIIDNTITGNSAIFEGGGIFCLTSSCSITGDSITENTADFGGGVSCNNCAPSITGNTIILNTANEHGGGISCFIDASPYIDSCTISNNNRDGVYSAWHSTPVLNYNNINDNSGYGVINVDSSIIIDAENNWWGDASGPGGFGPGTGDSVSQYVDYEPWLTEPVGIIEEKITPIQSNNYGATIFNGPLILPEGKKCKVYDITGRTVVPDKIKPGIYFIEIDGVVTQKVVKVR